MKRVWGIVIGLIGVLVGAQLFYDRGIREYLRMLWTINTLPMDEKTLFTIISSRSGSMIHIVVPSPK